jgi:KDO2-lipid IV(A) lauroyltransferase
MLDILYEGLGAVLQRLPVRCVGLLGHGVGRLMWYGLPSRRRLASEAISLHLDKTPRQARELGKANFAQTGKTFLELFLNRRVDPRFIQERIRISNPENLALVQGAERPVVAATAHLGSWELLAGIFPWIFGGRRMQIIVRLPKNRALGQILLHFRGHAGVEIVHNRQAAPFVLRCLKRNGVSAFLVDHNCGRSKAVFLPFFKKYAAVNVGPAVLAVRSGALVWPAFLLRDGDRGYVFDSHPPLDTTLLSGTLQERARQTASFYTAAVEKMVLRYPDQWFWMHKRWKTRPPWEKKAGESRAGRENIRTGAGEQDTARDL